ncbi:unnamed protein product [Onchocerca flexuosa]|uniref:Microsomal signal peptidase 25 kDa subunit n=1 Tax=Onchocerca flexuosa TaxID=387005 RepID=A0A183HIK4_9BILA|nr:unnamed protein product [Onchocerca flexuosa]
MSVFGSPYPVNSGSRYPMANLETRTKIRKDDIYELPKGSSLTTAVLIAVLCASFFVLTKNMQKPGCYRRPYNASQLGHEVLLEDGSHQFRIMVVTDLDKSSKHPLEENQWQSFIEFGILTINKEYTEASLQWKSNEQVEVIALHQ